MGKLTERLFLRAIERLYAYAAELEQRAADVEQLPFDEGGRVKSETLEEIARELRQILEELQK